VEFKDYYKVMGVARDATEAQIKQAYRRLARKYHPDVSKEKDAEARFKDVGEAYEVLRSPEKRAAYDQLGSGPRPGEEFRPPPDWGRGFEFSGAGPGAGPGGADQADYSDFFEALFGEAAKPRAAGRRTAAAVSTRDAAEIIMRRCCWIWTRRSKEVPGPSRCGYRRSTPRDA
jgi:curved DNA-binding protein